MRDKWHSFHFFFSRLSVPLGFTFIVAAQYLMGQASIWIPIEFLKHEHDIYRFWIPNAENAFIASILLIIGGCFLAYGVKGALIPAKAFYVKPRTIISEHQPVVKRRYIVWALLLIAAVLFGSLMSRLLPENGDNDLILSWLGVPLLIAISAYIYDRQTHIDLSPPITRWDLLFIGAILVIGLFIGCHVLERYPDAIAGDELGFFGSAVGAATEEGSVSVFGSGIYGFPLAGFYYAGAITRVFGISLWTWRFSSVLLAVLTVIPTYLLALEMFDRRVAVAACLIMISTPYFLLYARVGYNNIHAVPLVALASYFLYAGTRRTSVFYAALAGIAAGFGFYTYSAAKLGLVIGVLFMGCFILWRFFRYFRRHEQMQSPPLIKVLFVVAFIVSALVLILPQVVYQGNVDYAGAQHKTLESLFNNSFYALQIFPPEELYRDYPPTTVGSVTFFYRLDLYAILIARGFVRSILAFNMNFGWFDRGWLTVPLTGAIGSVFYFIGLVLALRRIRQKQLLLLVIWFTSGLLLLSILNTFPPRDQHLVPVIPAVAILTAVGVVVCADFVSNKFRGKSVSLLLISGVVCASFVVGVNNYFVDMRERFRPNVENILAFHAMNAKAPENVVYINADKTFLPWILRFAPTKVQFRSIDVEGLRANALDIDPTENISFFFQPENIDAVLPILEQKYHLQHIKPEAYFDLERRPILYSWVYHPQACINPKSDLCRFA